jgi:predicted nucleic acid-binding protein
MAFVLDNSVLLGWFVPTQGSAYTQRIAERAKREEPVVPALWEIEFANALIVLKRRRVLAPHAVAAALDRAARLKLTVDRDALVPRALVALGERHGISAYDAAYLELAERRGVPLATKDLSLSRAARAVGLLLN